MEALDFGEKGYLMSRRVRWWKIEERFSEKMNEDPPGDSNEDFQWKCRIGERKPAVIGTGRNFVFLQECDRQNKLATSLSPQLWPNRDNMQLCLNRSHVKDDRLGA